MNAEIVVSLIGGIQAVYTLMHTSAIWRVKLCHVALPMPKTGGHQIKWKKPDTERNVPHVLSYRWKFKKNKILDVEYDY
jgi:hypothetical protein